MFLYSQIDILDTFLPYVFFFSRFGSSSIFLLALSNTCLGFHNPAVFSIFLCSSRSLCCLCSSSGSSHLVCYHFFKDFFYLIPYQFVCISAGLCSALYFYLLLDPKYLSSSKVSLIFCFLQQFPLFLLQQLCLLKYSMFALCCP